MRQSRLRKPVLSTLAPRTIEMADFLKPRFRNSRSRVIDEAIKQFYKSMGCK